MMQDHSVITQAALQVFTKDTLIRGRPTQLKCVEINHQTFFVTNGPTRVASLEDEWHGDVEDPNSVIQTLTNSGKADVFTFWQRLPDVQPKHPYFLEWESIAALPIRSYDHWFKQISSRMRSQLRKSQREGLELRETNYDDAFVRGMTEIFNETPVRQGRPFWHYGKDFDTIKRQFSRNILHEEMVGAYFEGEMVGLMMLGISERYAVTGQLISKVKHRDKATNNALIAKAVEVCARKGLPYLVYNVWSDDGLAEFKRRCGFEESKVPRYFVPLTMRGKLAMKLGLHRGWRHALPQPVRHSLKKLRRAWFDFRARP